jgi:hypothetical protein
MRREAPSRWGPSQAGKARGQRDERGGTGGVRKASSSSNMLATPELDRAGGSSSQPMRRLCLPIRRCIVTVVPSERGSTRTASISSSMITKPIPPSCLRVWSPFQVT